MSERWDLRLGRWEGVLADVECDALICDPPFGQRTHAAWREGDDSIAKRLKRTLVTYDAWTAEDVLQFVRHWSARTTGWMAALTSHDLAPAWMESYEAAGRYSFAPIPFVTWGGSVRLCGGGPSSWTVWLMLARPRTRAFQKWQTTPGAYLTQGGHVHKRDGSGGGRGKPLDLMKAIVRDYSRPGDLICDPTAGLATTGVAALTMGRRFVGAECDPETFQKAHKRLAETQVVDLFDAGRATQESLL